MIHNKSPLVSVIVTTKNEEKNIERFLVSVKDQNYKNLEIIVVDNNSSDNTKIIAKKYTNKIFNIGPERSAQRNYGARKSQGKYLLILDADMELTENVVKECVGKIGENKAITIPEKTVGQGFMASVRKFERSMYMGDSSIEVARFFDKKTFMKFSGYDLSLTGAEDYDLPKRISEEHSIGRINSYILHHESGLTLFSQLRKKYYYANKSASYVDKHPDLISKQGILILRKAYIKHWRKFLKFPFLGMSLIIVRFLETLSAALGFLKAVGTVKFIQTFFRMFKYL